MFEKWSKICVDFIIFRIEKQIKTPNTFRMDQENEREKHSSKNGRFQTKLNVVGDMYRWNPGEATKNYFNLNNLLIQ